MFELSHVAYVVGALILALSVPAVLAPEAFIRGVKAFPRSKIPAWIMTAAGLFWVAWIVLHAHLGRFEFLKPAIYVAGPLGFVLIVVFMDELLAPRALGGLLMLGANPLLVSARWHPSPWRLVITVIAYIWVVAGMTFMLSPYRFRQLAEWANKTPARCRALGFVRVLFGVSVLFLGWRVY